MFDSLKPPFETPIDLMLASDKAYIAEVEGREIGKQVLSHWNNPAWPMPNTDIQKATDQVFRNANRSLQNAGKIMARAGTTMARAQRRLEEAQRQTLRSLDRQGNHRLPAVKPRTDRPLAIIVASSFILAVVVSIILGALL